MAMDWARCSLVTPARGRYKRFVIIQMIVKKSRYRSYVLMTSILELTLNVDKMS